MYYPSIPLKDVSSTEYLVQKPLEKKGSKIPGLILTLIGGLLFALGMFLQFYTTPGNIHDLWIWHAVLGVELALGVGSITCGLTSLAFEVVNTSLQNQKVQAEKQKAFLEYQEYWDTDM